MNFRPIEMPTSLILLCFFASMAGGSIIINTGDTPLPYKVYNNLNEHFPDIISQIGESCGSASGIGYVFNYEMSVARKTLPDDPSNSYPYSATYNFLNDGSPSNGTHTMFLDAWRFVRDNGIMNSIDFGKIDRKSTKWASGYEKYHRGMQNRIAAIDSVHFYDEGAFTTMKQWLLDHGNGIQPGGIFTITAAMLGTQVVSVTDGEGKGIALIYTFGLNPSAGEHDLTVVGYNDSVGYDFNYDGKITDDIDINQDGAVTMADNEKGAFVCANSWGTGNWSDGFAFVPYRLFVTEPENGGTLTNKAYFITVHKEYIPQRTYKIMIAHSSRNKVALAVGIAADTTASQPEYLRIIEQFSNTGGDHPLCGADAEDTIEIGLDVSDLADSLGENQSAAYFLGITVNDDKGFFNEFTYYDYSTTPVTEISSQKEPSPLNPGSNLLKIITPPTGIASHRTRHRQYLNNIHIRSGNRILEVVPPASSGELSVFNINGGLIGTWHISHSESYIKLPVMLKNGVYTLRFSDPRNRTVSETFQVIR